MKLTIRPDRETRERIELLKRLSRQKTAAKAIRWAIFKATEPESPTPTPPPREPWIQLAYDCLAAADKLPFVSIAERRVLGSLSRRLYHLAKSDDSQST